MVSAASRSSYPFAAEFDRWGPGEDARLGGLPLLASSSRIEEASAAIESNFATSSSSDKRGLCFLADAVW